MSPLLVRSRPPDEQGCMIAVTPQSAGWRYVGFKMARLAPGDIWADLSPGRETCLVVLSGSARVLAGGRDFGVIGGRSSVFEDKAPGAVYVPAGMRCQIIAEDAVDLALCTAPGQQGGAARLIAVGDMPREVRGQGSNTRYVRNILPETAPADSLLVVEVVTPGGHWSSYPPHKHDTAAAGAETALEETYYHRLNPPQGFAVQRVYTDDRSLDETISVQDGDVVMVPRGYHPVGAPTGYDLYYLNVMAGPERRWIFRNDPAHEWIIRKS